MLKNLAYNFPNDEREQDRYDLMHEVFVAGMGDKLFFAPVNGEMSRVLDIGTGTGIWAIQLGWSNILETKTQKSPADPFCRCCR